MKNNNILKNFIKTAGAARTACIINTKYALTVGLAVVMYAAAFGQTDSLPHYLRIAEENNQGLMSARSLYRASLERVPQAAALPDPQLDVGIPIPPMELVDGRQIAQFQVMQMFPWPGARKAARTETEQMAKMYHEQYREARDQLRLDVYTQWMTLGRLNRQLKNNRANRELLVQLEELALRRFSAPTGGASGGSMGGMGSTGGMNGGGMGGMGTTGGMSSMGGGMGSTGGGMSGMGGSMGGMGSASVPQSIQQSAAGAGSTAMGMSDGGMMSSAAGGMSSVLRVQIEIAGIDNNIESILSEIQAETAKFNALLDRRPNSVLQIPDTLIQTDFVFDEESIMALVKEQNPTLGALDAEEYAIIAKTEMDRRMGYPMIGVGLQYMLNIKRRHALGGMESMNGMDMFMPMVSVSLPIFRGKHRARRRENDLMYQSHCEMGANALSMIEAELHRIKSGLDNAERKIALYKRQSELANTVYSLTLQEFVSGKGDLSGVIQAQRQLLEYELMAAEAVADFNVTVAQVGRLVSF